MVALLAGVSFAQETTSSEDVAEDVAEDRAYPAPKKPYLKKNKPSVIAPGYRPVSSAYGAPTSTYPSPAPASLPTAAAYQAGLPAYPVPAAYRPNPTPAAYKKPAPAYPAGPAYSGELDYKPSGSAPYVASPYKPAASPVDGRVKMQVYRGANKDYNKEDSFASWGYSINQPADN